MSVARRPLLTATAAGTLLCALGFVPSANANVEKQAQEHRRGGSPAAPATNGAATQGEQELLLAQTGSMNTTPYLVAGTAFLSIGAGFVAYSVRRRTSSPAAF